MVASADLLLAALPLAHRPLARLLLNSSNRDRAIHLAQTRAKYSARLRRAVNQRAVLAGSSLQVDSALPPLVVVAAGSAVDSSSSNSSRARHSRARPFPDLDKFIMTLFYATANTNLVELLFSCLLKMHLMNV